MQFHRIVGEGFSFFGSMENRTLARQGFPGLREDAPAPATRSAFFGREKPRFENDDFSDRGLLRVVE